MIGKEFNQTPLTYPMLKHPRSLDRLLFFPCGNCLQVADIGVTHLTEGSLYEDY